MYRIATKRSYRTKSKYHNVSQEFGGRRYDSKREAVHAQELAWRQKAGEIKEIIPQFKIDLKVNGYQICRYYVDFKVIMKDDSVQFHEVKGFSTDVFILKKKLFEALLNDIEPGAEYLIIR